MDDIEKEDVLDFAAELSVVDEDAWDRILAFVNQFELTAGDTDEDRAMARIYLAAHMATKAMPSASAGTVGAVGPLTSESVGGVRRSYGLVALTSAGSLGTTKYGQMYLDALALTLCNTGMVV